MENNELDQVVEQQTTQELNTLSRPELVEALRKLLENENISEIREKADQIKTLFYRQAPATEPVQNEEVETEEGEENEVKLDPVEEEFKLLFAQYRERKAQYLRKLEEEQEANYQKKCNIIERLKELISANDEAADINTFRALQNEWNSIGAVPVTKSTALWQEYNSYRDKFFDIKKIEAELRDYAFKKNLEAKNKIIEIAQSLIEEQDVIKAFQTLQKLHDQWREIGPVSREIREELWGKFKALSTQINKRHQDFYTQLREQEEALAKEKEAYCVEVESIDFTTLLTFKDWEEKTKIVTSFNDKFQSKSPLERRINQKMYKRYRSACDKFFAAKANFYQQVKTEQQENLEKKRALVAKAEELKTSTSWNSTAEKLKALQKEWKEIGPTPRKNSDEIWAQFTAACDYFFEQKNNAFKEKYSEEQTNLRMKMELIEQIKSFTFTGNDEEDYSALRTLADQFQTIGHIPFKDKDRVYELFRQASQEKFNKLKSRRRAAQLQLGNDRNKLIKHYESLKQQIATYENNIGFFKSSKGSNSIIRDLEDKIKSLKEDLNAVAEQIKKLNQE